MRICKSLQKQQSLSGGETYNIHCVSKNSPL